LGDGTFRYQYSIDNSVGTFGVFTWSLEFNFNPDWDQRDVFSGGSVLVPNGDWTAKPGVPLIGFAAQDFVSFFGEVTVGDTLGEFAFISKYPPGIISYNEFGALGEFAYGTTIGPMLVPEPDTMIPMILTFLVGCGWYHWKHRNLSRARDLE